MGQLINRMAAARIWLSGLPQSKQNVVVVGAHYKHLDYKTSEASPYITLDVGKR
jgi:hypothetical protein